MGLLRRATIGDERRIGLWLLPLFLLTAALAATLAGGLAVLYYSQQVSSLRSETASARAQLDEAVATVEDAVEDATSTIDDQVARVRAQLAQGAPVESPNDAGVYAVAARHDDGAVRVGSAFVVFSDSNETFLVTSFGVIGSGGSAVDRVEVYLPGQTVTGAVHGFDRRLDLATVVLRGGPLPVTEWRPPEAGLEIGDALYLLGIGGPDTPAIVEGRLAALSPETLVATAPVNSFTAGGPLVDTEGRVVGVATLDYEPFGPGTGALGYTVPIRALCDGLLRCTASDVGAGSLGEVGEIDETTGPTAPGARAEPGAPSPSPSPRPTPAPTPTPDATGSPSPAPTASPPDAQGEQDGGDG